MITAQSYKMMNKLTSKEMKWINLKTKSKAPLVAAMMKFGFLAATMIAATAFSSCEPEDNPIDEGTEQHCLQKVSH
jgi:hypothetical protein